MTQKTNTLSNSVIADSFSKAAVTYESVAFIQKEIAKRLCDRLELIQCQPQRILDLGAGTGFCTQLLAQRFPKAQIIALDLAEGMCQFYRKHRSVAHTLCADAQRLPIASNSFDLIVSSLLFHWLDDLPMALIEIQRVLKSEGILLFSSLGPDTLLEIRHSWDSVDDCSHVLDFQDMHNIGDDLLAARFEDPVMDQERIVLTYKEITQCLRELKNSGATNLTQGRMHGLMSVAKFKQFMKNYESLRLPDGAFPATYEVIYGFAKGNSMAVADQNGEVRIPIEEIKRKR